MIDIVEIIRKQIFYGLFVYTALEFLKIWSNYQEVKSGNIKFLLGGGGRGLVDTKKNNLKTKYDFQIIVYFRNEESSSQSNFTNFPSRNQQAIKNVTALFRNNTNKTTINKKINTRGAIKVRL